MKRTRPANPATWETVHEIARVLPGAVEGTSYGTPAFHIRKKLFVRLHQSGEAVVVMVDMAERKALMAIDPETCFITDHYLNHPAMLVRLATVWPKALRELIKDSWRSRAPANSPAPKSSAPLGPIPPSPEPASSPGATPNWCAFRSLRHHLGSTRHPAALGLVQVARAAGSAMTAGSKRLRLSPLPPALWGRGLAL
jgi:hypothetical protein